MGVGRLHNERGVTIAMRMAQHVLVHPCHAAFAVIRGTLELAHQFFIGQVGNGQESAGQRHLEVMRNLAQLGLALDINKDVQPRQVRRQRTQEGTDPTLVSSDQQTHGPGGHAHPELIAVGEQGEQTSLDGLGKTIRQLGQWFRIAVVVVRVAKLRTGWRRDVCQANDRLGDVGGIDVVQSLRHRRGGDVECIPLSQAFHRTADQSSLVWRVG
jgi:hypothetical protein